MKKPIGRPRHDVPRQDRYKSILINYELKEKLDKYKNKLNAKSYASLFEKFMQLVDNQV